MVKLGLEIRSAVLLPQAQHKREPEELAWKQTTGICAEAKEALELVRKVRPSGKALLHSQLFWYFAVDGTAEFPWPTVFLS